MVNCQKLVVSKIHIVTVYGSMKTFTVTFFTLHQAKSIQKNLVSEDIPWLWKDTVIVIVSLIIFNLVVKEIVYTQTRGNIVVYIQTQNSAECFGLRRRQSYCELGTNKPKSIMCSIFCLIPLLGLHEPLFKMNFWHKYLEDIITVRSNSFNRWFFY